MRLIFDPTGRSRTLLALLGLISASLIAGTADAVELTETTEAATQQACPVPTPGAHRDHLGAPGNVALTFDDGPHPVYTPIILDLLADHGVRATFFPIGRNVDRYPELLQRVVDEGHLVGNHTQTHPTSPDHMDALPTADRIREMDDATRAVRRATGATPCFFRAPQGYHVSTETMALANDRGMQVSGWTASSRDVGQPHVFDQDYVDGMVERTTKPSFHRPTLLWHDTADKPNTPPAVDRTIQIYKDRGYGFVDPAGREIPPVSADLLPICPAPLRVATDFVDLPSGNVHRHAIMCAVQHGVISGRSSTSFAPNRSMTRGQLATMLDRQLQEHGVTLDDDVPVTFTDISTSTHAPGITRLAAAGIINGRTDGTFGPDAVVTREQMASLIDGAATRGFHLQLGGSGPHGFADVPATGAHAGSVDRLAAARIVAGTGNDRFEPAQPVNRAQAASILMRLHVQLG